MVKRAIIKRLTTNDRNYYARQVMAFIRGLADIKEEDRLPLPPKRKSKDPLVCCLQDYFQIYTPSSLNFMADYENRAIVLDILTDDKSKQMVLIPHQGLGTITLIEGKIPDKARIEAISVDNSKKLFNITSQEISDEVDRAMYSIGCKIQKRFKEENPDHNRRLAGGDLFPPLPN